MGQKRISPRLIPSWQWSVLHGMVPPPFSITRIHSKLRAAISNKEKEFTNGASEAEYAWKSAWRKKELTLQVEVDELGCVEPLEHVVMARASAGTR